MSNQTMIFLMDETSPSSICPDIRKGAKQKSEF